MLQIVFCVCVWGHSGKVGIAAKKIQPFFPNTKVLPFLKPEDLLGEISSLCETLTYFKEETCSF